MRAPQIYTKFDQDLLFQIRISARASKINDMAVRQRRNEQTHPSRDLLVDAPPPRTTVGEKRLVKGEQGDLRRPEGEGGRSRMAEAGRRSREAGGERGRAALGRAALWGTETSHARGGSDLVRAGEIFLVLF